MKPPDVIHIDSKSRNETKIKNAFDLLQWAFDNQDDYLHARAMQLIFKLRNQL